MVITKLGPCYPPINQWIQVFLLQDKKPQFESRFYIKGYIKLGRDSVKALLYADSAYEYLNDW